MLSVFVSARFEEFRGLRDVLSKRLDLKFDLAAVNLDDGRAVPVGPTQRSLDAVRACDAMVLLVGDTYIGDNPDDPDRSLTHREYDAAVAADKPVFVFATPGSPARDERVSTWLASVEAARTTGRLEVGVLGAGEAVATNDAVDRIVNDVTEWFGTLDADDNQDGLPTTFGRQLEGELAFLGLKTLDTYAMDPPRIAREPTYNQLIEHRRMAMSALSSDDIETARHQLRTAIELYQLDWASNFLLARLLSVRGQGRQLDDAADLARRAAMGVDDLDHAPQKLSDATTAITRRTAATRVMQCRIERLRGNLAAADRFADEALALDGGSRNVLIEKILVAGLRSDLATAQAQAAVLLRVAPDRAATLMRAPEVQGLQPRLEAHLVGLVCDRIGQAGRALGVEVSERPPARLRDALTSYRRLAREHLDAVGTEFQKLSTAWIWNAPGFGRAEFTDLGRRAAQLDATERDALARVEVPTGADPVEHGRQRLAEIEASTSSIVSPPNWRRCWQLLGLSLVAAIVVGVLDAILGAVGSGLPGLIRFALVDLPLLGAVGLAVLYARAGINVHDQTEAARRELELAGNLQVLVAASLARREFQVELQARADAARFVQQWATYNRAFSALPNWIYPGYRPGRVAGQGAVTRVDSGCSDRFVGGFLPATEPELVRVCEPAQAPGSTTAFRVSAAELFPFFAAAPAADLDGWRHLDAKVTRLALSQR